MRFVTRLRFPGLAALSLAANVALAQPADPPRPPCSATTAQAPAFPAPDRPPAILAWSGDAIGGAGWPADECTGWRTLAGTRVVVALAGTFAFAGTLDDLLARVGRMSATSGIRYWSTTDRAWQPLVLEGKALADADPRSGRDDFTAAELRRGAVLHYRQRDNRSGDVVYRMQARVDGDRARITTENLTPIRYLLVTAFPPGALQTVQWLQPVRPGVWGLYVLMRTGPGTSRLADSHDASFRNRAAALFRHLAGIPTDREPPAAP